jgi:CDP-diacylglycerol--glycerol-3-phosphate 3-phosphatidyltransferase
VQTVAIAMYLADLPWVWWDVSKAVVMGVAVVLTVVTGIDYLVRAWRLRLSGTPATQVGDRA